MFSQSWIAFFSNEDVLINHYNLFINISTSTMLECSNHTLNWLWTALLTSHTLQQQSWSSVACVRNMYLNYRSISHYESVYKYRPENRVRSCHERIKRPQYCYGVLSPYSTGFGRYASPSSAKCFQATANYILS